MEGARAIREEAAYLRRGVSVAPPSAGQRRLTLGEYCEQTRDDTLLREWHPTLNDSLTPETVTYGSHYKVWWICGEGHVWKATVVNRAGKKKTGCPVCAGVVSKESLRRGRAAAELRAASPHW